jgi:hypothetical protein
MDDAPSLGELTMKKFEFEGKTLKGRVKSARLIIHSGNHVSTLAAVETTEGMFDVFSEGDIEDGDWKPFLVRKSEKLIK